MIYCKLCTYPLSTVNLAIDDDGICSGCLVSQEKSKIDWQEREQEFKNILLQYKENKVGDYDCILPVSGGKDSTFQAVYLKNLGLNPLMVTYFTHNYTDTGILNLENISKSVGLDHYIFRPNFKVIQKMNRIGFRMLGDMSWHFHCGIYTVPFIVANKFNIPLCVYGEHGGVDLVGQFSLNDKPEFTKRLRKEDILRGFSWRDFLGKESLSETDLSWAKFPKDSDIEKNKIRGIFMGNYLFWDAHNNLEIAKEYGFKENPTEFERTYRRSSNVDDIHENGIKDYLKFVKFGYGRATDHTSKDIRLGKMTRKEGIEMVKKYDHVKAKMSLSYFLEMTGMSEEEFDITADKFRDPRVWYIKENKWYKKNIWGGESAYGDVYLSKEEREKYEQNEKNY